MTAEDVASFVLSKEDDMLLLLPLIIEDCMGALSTTAVCRGAGAETTESSSSSRGVSSTEVDGGYIEDEDKPNDC